MTGCFVLISNAPKFLRDACREMAVWMEPHGYGAIGQMRSRMSRNTYNDPAVFEWENDIRVL